MNQIKPFIVLALLVLCLNQVSGGLLKRLKVLSGQGDEGGIFLGRILKKFQGLQGEGRGEVGRDEVGRGFLKTIGRRFGLNRQESRNSDGMSSGYLPLMRSFLQ